VNRPKKNPPFEFILDALYPLPVAVRPMFGSHAVYLGPRILMVLRRQDSHPEANGLWIATTHAHHASLTATFPALVSVGILNGGRGETAWRMLPAEAPTFESDALQLCELVRRGDPRIGRIPKARAKSKRKGAQEGR
jgi:hypothetical protein